MSKNIQQALGAYEKGNYQESIALCHLAISEKKSAIDGVRLLALNQMAIKNYDSCISLFKQVIDSNEALGIDFYNLGIAHAYQDQRQDALLAYDRALKLSPDLYQAYHNRANLLRDDHLLDQALLDYDRVIRIKPDHHDALLNKAITLFLKGDLQSAWPLYEHRLKGREANNKVISQSGIRWMGQAVKGKKLCIYAEQGLGDSIQFLRYLTPLKEAGADIYLYLQSPLRSLVNENYRDVTHLSDLPHMSEFDYHCPLPSLPFVFNTSLATIPHSSAYLSPMIEKVNVWESRLSSKWQPRVGLVWSGNPNHPNDKNRSIKLSHLLSKLPSGFEYLAIQNEINAEDKKILVEQGISSFSEYLVDFSDTAALCQCLDLIITVDTSVAHLCGAMGKNAWMLLPFAPDWRWMLERMDSPWYSSLRLYRQDQHRSWDSVLDRLAPNLLKIDRVF
jgi:Tfp pilus assembly protein PilF